MRSGVGGREQGALTFSHLSRFAWHDFAVTVFKACSNVVCCDGVSPIVHGTPASVSHTSKGCVMSGCAVEMNLNVLRAANCFLIH